MVLGASSFCGVIVTVRRLSESAIDAATGVADCVSATDVLVTLIGSIASLNVSTIFVVGSWFADALAGDAVLSVGAAVSSVPAASVNVCWSWFGAAPYSGWLRSVRGLTDWILEPLQRILPPMGPMDFSPLVAYFLLRVAQQVVVGALFR